MKTSILIIDDIFPSLYSGFRFQEISAILNNIPDSLVCHTFDNDKLLSDKSGNYHHREYKKKYPHHKDKIFELADDIVVQSKILYGLFLNTAWDYLLPLAEKYHKNFIFTLYPGGGLELDDYVCDEKLRKILSSTYLSKVIVTQENIYNYLLSKKFCSEEKIEYIFGVVTPLDNIGIDISNKNYYGYNKDILDVCFTSHRYTDNGAEKGYLVFLETAKKLSEIYNNVRFHVVGDFDESIADVKGISTLEFHGVRSQEWFDGFYKDIDIILSPNFVKEGQKTFDGFPTASATDAGLRGVALFVADSLRLGSQFINDKEIVIIDNNINKIVDKIGYYINSPKKLKDLAINGYQKINKLYNYDHQVLPRIKLLKKSLLEIALYNLQSSNDEDTDLINEYINFINNQYLSIQEKNEQLNQELTILERQNLAFEWRVVAPQLHRIRKKTLRITKKSLNKIRDVKLNKSHQYIENIENIMQVLGNNDNNKKNILVLPSWYPTIERPLEGSFFREQAQLMEDEFNTLVLYGRQNGDMSRGVSINLELFPQDPGVVGFEYSCNGALTEQETLQWTINYYSNILTEMLRRGWRPNLIHAHTTYIGGIIAEELGRKFNIPVVITEHQMFLLHNFTHFMRDKIINALNNVQTVASVSTDKKRAMLMHQIDRQVLVVGNYVDETLFKLSVKSKPKDTFNLLIVAGATYIKDMPVFFDALYRLRSNSKFKVYTTVVGGGVWGDHSHEEMAKEKQVADICTFIDMLPRESMPQIYADCDIFVTTSIAEGFQVSVLEAMAVGRPVVSTSHGGVEDIANKKNSLVVPVRDSEAVANAIESMMQNYNQYKPEEIRKIAVTRYGKKAFKSTIKNMYENTTRDYENKK